MEIKYTKDSRKADRKKNDPYNQDESSASKPSSKHLLVNDKGRLTSTGKVRLQLDGLLDWKPKALVWFSSNLTP